jgi:hypothetical protein
MSSMAKVLSVNINIDVYITIDNY